MSDLDLTACQNYFSQFKHRQSVNCVKIEVCSPKSGLSDDLEQFDFL